jgi:hypothetical protein
MIKKMQTSRLNAQMCIHLRKKNQKRKATTEDESTYLTCSEWDEEMKKSPFVATIGD